MGSERTNPEQFSFAALGDSTVPLVVTSSSSGVSTAAAGEDDPSLGAMLETPKDDGVKFRGLVDSPTENEVDISATSSRDKVAIATGGTSAEHNF